MYYVIQENTFKEDNYYNLVETLDRMKLPYEIVKVLPFIEDFEFKTDRKDVFCFGSVKMARLAKKYEWFPGSQLNENHDYRVYRKYYKDNLLNYDSVVQKFGDDINRSEVVDDGALEFCKEMVDMYKIANSFVIDICEVIIDGKAEYKIIELGCINSAGFYSANMPKIIDALEEEFKNKIIV